MQGRATIEIDHPGGEEIQWDWFERRRAPWGGTAYVLLGTLPHSSRVRGVLAESLDQPHLIEAMHQVLVRLGGTARVWRTDRLATVIVPGSRDVQPSFAPGGEVVDEFAVHGGLGIEVEVVQPPWGGQGREPFEAGLAASVGCGDLHGQQPFEERGVGQFGLGGVFEFGGQRLGGRAASRR